MKTQEFFLPDQAVSYIVSHYLEVMQQKEVPIVLGISQKTVESVLQLFIDWAGKYGYLKDGVLTLEGLSD